MKFKQTDGQNQRIEQIITSHLVVGIDIKIDLILGDEILRMSEYM